MVPRAGAYAKRSRRFYLSRSLILQRIIRSYSSPSLALKAATELVDDHLSSKSPLDTKSTVRLTKPIPAAPPLRAVCPPRPPGARDELEHRPVTSYPTCKACGKRFAHGVALSRHKFQCALPYQCQICFQKFKQLWNLAKHSQVHNAVREQFPCPDCGETFLYEYTLKKHRLANPGPHASTRRLRHLQIHPDLLTDGTFFQHEPVLDRCMQHATTLKNQESITKEEWVRPNRNGSMVLDGVMLREDAPACAHFKVTASSAGGLPISSFVPSYAEPGEVLGRLIVNLDVLDPEKYRPYLAALGNETYRRTSPVRATILFATPEWYDWAEEHCLPLDLKSNPLLWREHDGDWHVATKIRDTAAVAGEEHSVRPLGVTVIVAGGVRLNDESSSWQRVFRMFKDRESVVCPLCPFITSDYHLLTDHEMREHRGRLFTCSQCSELFRHESSLESHRRTAHSDSLLQCPDCTATFKSTGGLRAHRLSVHEGKVWTCVECKIEYASKTTLQDHIKVVHEGRRWECAECGQKYTRHLSLRRHMIAAHSGATFKCHDCSLEFRHKVSLRRHRLFVHERPLSRLTCEQCSSVFESRTQLREHLAFMPNEHTESESLPLSTVDFESNGTFDCFELVAEQRMFLHTTSSQSDIIDQENFIPATLDLFPQKSVKQRAPALASLHESQSNDSELNDDSGHGSSSASTSPHFVVFSLSPESDRSNIILPLSLSYVHNGVVDETRQRSAESIGHLRAKSSNSESEPGFSTSFQQQDIKSMNEHRDIGVADGGEPSVTFSGASTPPILQSDESGESTIETWKSTNSNSRQNTAEHASRGEREAEALSDGVAAVKMLKLDMRWLSERVRDGSLKLYYARTVPRAAVSPANAVDRERLQEDNVSVGVASEMPHGGIRGHDIQTYVIVATDEWVKSQEMGEQLVELDVEDNPLIKLDFLNHWYIASRIKLPSGTDAPLSVALAFPDGFDLSGVASQSWINSQQVKVVAGGKRPGFACPWCARSDFSKVDLLKQHYITAHAVMSFACPVCARSFKYRLHVESHMKRAHTGEAKDSPPRKRRRGVRKRFSCFECPKVFTSEKNYRYHREHMHAADFEAEMREIKLISK